MSDRYTHGPDQYPEDPFEPEGHGDGYDEEEAPEEPRRRRSGVKMALIGLLVLVLVGVGALVGFVAYLNHTVSTNISHDRLLPTEGAVITGEDGTLITAAPAPDRDPDAGDSRNILLLGTDSRNPATERGRSDVIVLMHISDDRESVHLIHFPRDLFVQIPGYDRRNKINAAYAYGGAPLLVQTLEQLIDVPIDNVAMVNFETFTRMTDAIGGVDVEVAEASPGFPEGVMHMDGETGLRFVRERYTLSQGDISRGQRQQAFIKAVMLKALSRETLTNPARLAGLVDAATQNLVVDENFEVSEMRGLAFEMRNIRGDDIKFITAPWQGIGMDDFAGSIVLMHEEQMEKLSAHLKTDTMDDYVDEVSPRQGFGR
ncbi:MAG TPA: LCP family protein [Ornithinicoccus sp.]|jgi:LCP family protein required for cell wall assembly|nr:LCP family protein [Ornithinicoccus sp.]